MLPGNNQPGYWRQYEKKRTACRWRSRFTSFDDTAIAAADTLLLTVPNQLGVDYDAHVIESVLKYVAPELGWR